MCTKLELHEIGEEEKEQAYMFNSFLINLIKLSLIHNYSSKSKCRRHSDKRLGWHSLKCTQTSTVFHWVLNHKYGGPGKSTARISADFRQASVGRASRRGEGGAESGRRLAENVYVDLP
jgi:hypothetical protein